jgi:RNA polymerase sigma-70 factor (ECF subfamily)
MSDTTAHLQHCVNRLQDGEEAARRELVNAACHRLTRLTRKMFRADGRLRRWEETGDVFQNAMLRLCRALQDVTPTSLREFYRLAALQVRRALIDLARHHYGPAGPAAHHQSQPRQPEAPDLVAQAAESSSLGNDPSRLAAWSEFHQRVATLPDEEREAFDLLWYQGLTHAEAGQLLEVSTKTIQRRWQSACLMLHEALGGEMPGL